MRHPTPHGFVLILAIVAVGLVAASLLILAGLANAILFDANQEYLQACNRNLTASALAWAQHNRDKISDASGTGKIELDVSCLNVTDGYLHITLLEPQKRAARLQISTECRREAMKLKRSDIYSLRPR